MTSKKTPGQIKREIADILASPTPTSKTSHSAKALATLSIMGTDPADWGLTPIDWVEEEREIEGLVRCPVCRGYKFVRFSDGQVVQPPSIRPYGNCPRCGVLKRGWGIIPQGKVKGRVLAKVKVGYPRFPPGTRFDSRFFGGLHCNLCNKLVLKSRRVPVHAIGRDGVKHGMFVGEDCARKFLDVKIKRDDDSIMETGNAEP